MKSDQPLKRQIVIHIDDWCDLPFQLIDIKYWNDELSKMLINYNIEITKIEIKEENEIRPT